MWEVWAQSRCRCGCPLRVQTVLDDIWKMEGCKNEKLKKMKELR